MGSEAAQDLWWQLCGAGWVWSLRIGGMGGCGGVVCDARRGRRGGYR